MYSFNEFPGGMLVACAPSAPSLPAANGAEPGLGSGLATRGEPVHRAMGGQAGTLVGGHRRARDWLWVMQPCKWTLP